MRALGIDPGLSGALAIVDASPGIRPRFVATLDIPALGEKAKRRVDVVAVADWLHAHEPIDVAVIERAMLMPGQNISAGSIYMRAVGALEAIPQLGKVPLEFAESATWKKICAVKPAPIAGETKEARKSRSKVLSRQRVLALFPEARDQFARVKDHNRAEAVLLAYYGLKLRLAT